MFYHHHESPVDDGKEAPLLVSSPCVSLHHAPSVVIRCDSCFPQPLIVGVNTDLQMHSPSNKPHVRTPALPPEQTVLRIFCRQKTPVSERPRGHSMQRKGGSDETQVRSYCPTLESSFLRYGVIMGLASSTTAMEHLKSEVDTSSIPGRHQRFKKSVAYVS
jgi:hypothetical protein